ncbi:MAG: ATP-binding cassette domain-containing protein [Streptococcaceae bacterium]|nr:ATP-binding cassette domain-containing protein [Streptococcaceae bacterium]
MLELKNIKKSYTTGDFTQTALDGVTVNFRQNEFVAILGPSGSGKTTLLNIIGGLDRYDSGNLVINGKSTEKFKDRDWDAYRNNSVGFIFQSYNLISHLNIMENVEMGMTLSGVKRQEKRARATEVLTRVGLSEHLHKKPNQLSGGQMQRVAIARALANNPDIILADEPTGALDTTTSGQIMALIQEIAQDKLVVMVTHNPELAKDYANRTIDVRDGKIEGDSNAYDGKGTDTGYTLKKTAMSFLTALNLSSRNISTKIMRTSLTAFAASIGIIGIALILSLSNGFQKQIDQFQENALSDFPIIISPASMSLSGDDLQALQGNTNRTQSFPDGNKVLSFDPNENSIMHRNIITPEYEKYIRNISPEDVSNIGFVRSVGLNLFRKVDNQVHQINLQNRDSNVSGGMQSTQGMTLSTYPTQLPGQTTSFLESNYDVLAGHLPGNMFEMVLVVDSRNRIPQNTLRNLGFSEDQKEIAFEDFIGMEIKLVSNDVFYEKTPIGNFMPRTDLDAVFNDGTNTTLKISAVIRQKEDSNMAFLGTGLAYSDDLVDEVLHLDANSAIVQAQKEADHNVMTMQAFENEAAKTQMLQFLGGDSTPIVIMIYPVSFDRKEAILEYLDEWNKGKDQADKIIYTDLAATVTNLTGGIMSAITMVLIAFASISLVVSLIMVGIITYISVLERTKEIGVLRALGARKKDITRVFNAETFIIGMFSGLLGIGIAYLLTIPANIVIENATDLQNVAQLDPLHAIMLVTISVVLTLIGGAIPARMAAKKDPVIALRTE